MKKVAPLESVWLLLVSSSRRELGAQCHAGAKTAKAKQSEDPEGAVPLCLQESGRSGERDCLRPWKTTPIREDEVERQRLCSDAHAGLDERSQGVRWRASWLGGLSKSGHWLSVIGSSRSTTRF